MSWSFGAHPDDAPRPTPAADAPAARTPYRSVSSQIVLRPRADTKAIVVVELLPLAPALALGSLTMFDLLSFTAVWVLTAIVAAVFASRDRGVLLSRGFVGVPSGALALVHPLLYVALRGRACRGLDSDAFAPMPWAIGATVLGAIGLILDAVFFSGVSAGIGSLAGLLG